MTEILSSLLNLVALYGYPIVAATVFVGYLGIPVPSEGVLLAAGALSADGSLNFYLLILLVAGVAVCGDILAYALGKKYGIQYVKKYGKYLAVNQQTVDGLSKSLNTWGMGAIFVTRWLLTPLGTPVSLLSGITNYSFKYFLAAVTAGELLWVTIYVYLGYFLGSNWLTIYTYLDNFFWVILTASVGIVLIYLGFRVYQNRIN